MIKVIGMDESGSFELTRDSRGSDLIIEKDEVVFVGGYTFVFDENKSSEEKISKEIVELLKGICKVFQEQCHLDKTTDKLIEKICTDEGIELGPVLGEMEVIFPVSLHGSSDNNEYKTFAVKYPDGKYKNFRKVYTWAKLKDGKIKKDNFFYEYMSKHLKDSKFEETEYKDEDGTKKIYRLLEDEKENAENWEKIFSIYLQKKVLCYLKEKKAKMICYFYPKYTDKDDMILGDMPTINRQYHVSNLYEKMAENFVYGQIINGNDLESYDKYLLKLPTRVLDRKNIQEGNYEGEYKVNGERLEIVTPSFFKAILKNMEIYGITEDRIVQDARSIRYNQTNKDSDLTPFHYISDTVCSYIRDKFKNIATGKKNGTNIISKLRNNKDISEILKKISETVENDAGMEFEIRIYSKCDVIISNAIINLRDGRLDNYFYEISKLSLYEKGDYKDTFGIYKYYWSEWKNNKLEKLLQESCNEANFNKLVLSNMDEICKTFEHCMTKGFEYQRGSFLGIELYRIFKSVEVDGKNILSHMNNKQKLNFYTNLCRAYNHRGDIKNVRIIYQVAEDLLRERDVLLDDIFTFENVTLQAELNALDYVQASNKVRTLEDNISKYLASRREIQESEVRGGDLDSATQARVYSSMGQAMSFLLSKDIYLYNHGDVRVEDEMSFLKEKAQDYFEKAIQFFCKLKVKSSGKDQTDAAINENISISHYLIYFCMLKDRKNYETYATRYFGTGDIKEQYESLKLGERVNAFGCRIFVKAMLEIYIDDTSNDELLGNLIKALYECTNKASYDHPWELTYFNMVQIIEKKGWTEEYSEQYEKFYQVAKKIHVDDKTHQEDLQTIRIIRLHTRLLRATERKENCLGLKLKHSNLNTNQFDVIKDISLLKMFDVLPEDVENMTFGELLFQLDALLGYAYC